MQQNINQNVTARAVKQVHFALKSAKIIRKADWDSDFIFSG